MSKTLVHRHLVLSVSNALAAIFFEKQFAERVVEQALFKNKKWGARDRRFFADSVYGCVRWWRKLWYALDQEPSADLDLLFQCWNVYWFLQNREWAFPISDAAQIESRLLQVKPRSIEQSIPEWMDAWGSQELQDRWPAILERLNQPAGVYLRCNSIKGTREQVQAELAKIEIQTLPLSDCENGLTLAARKNVFSTECYKAGGFEMQDRGSQRIAPLIPVKPGDRVIDACAGAGGKTLHLAALMQNRGKIIAMDIHEWKLQELRKRAARAGVDIVETRLIDSTKAVKRLEASADAVLLDVPCSGLGVLRRHPDTKWKLSAERLVEIRQLQSDLLVRYSKMVRVGGHLLYATCSMMPSENEQQVEHFMQQVPNWELKQIQRLDPDEYDGDGFFAALLLRLPD